MPQSTVINTKTVVTNFPPHTKIIRDLNKFVTKLNDLSSKVYNLHVCLNKFVSGANEAAEKKLDTVPRI